MNIVLTERNLHTKMDLTVKCRGIASYGAYGLKKCRNTPKEDEFDRENLYIGHIAEKIGVLPRCKRKVGHFNENSDYMPC